MLFHYSVSQIEIELLLSSTIENFEYQDENMAEMWVQKDFVINSLINTRDTILGIPGMQQPQAIAIYNVFNFLQQMFEWGTTDYGVALNQYHRVKRDIHILLPAYTDFINNCFLRFEIEMVRYHPRIFIAEVFFIYIFSIESLFILADYQ